ncbi:PIN domain-containing protein [Bradyrhizobium sp. RT11b]|uniref:PIN domain-containing protein n=1 Tax=Bradyrhizobium sp. RT11b TaxID=3156332 RepID=UPI00339A9A8E
MDPVRSWPSGLLVADASVWINLVAGARPADVIRVLAMRPQIPRIALDELERGRGKGRRTAAAVADLIKDGLVEVAELPSEAEETYLNLVAGPVSQTLDDGEAATLALALHVGAVAIIDERKALNLARDRFPVLHIMSTTELLLSDTVRSAFSKEELASLLYGALREARMRVPEHLLEAVCTCLGPERTVGCVSLPARARQLTGKTLA